MIDGVGKKLATYESLWKHRADANQGQTERVRRVGSTSRECRKDVSEREPKYALQLVRTVVRHVLATMYEYTRAQLMATLLYTYTEDTKIDRHICA